MLLLTLLYYYVFLHSFLVLNSVVVARQQSAAMPAAAKFPLLPLEETTARLDQYLPYFLSSHPQLHSSSHTLMARLSGANVLERIEARV